MLFSYFQLVGSLLVFVLSSFIIVTRINLKSRVVVKIALLAFFAYSVFAVGNAINLLSILFFDYVVFVADIDMVKLMYVVQLLATALLLYADLTRREFYGEQNE